MKIKHGLFAVLFGANALFATNLEVALRALYQNHDAATSQDAIGASVSLHATNSEGPYISGLRAQLVLTNQDRGFGGVALVDENSTGFFMLTELYMGYKTSLGILKAGRMLIDTPFAGPHDIGLVPNSFEAITFEAGNKNGGYQLGYLYAWAGVDADEIRRFNKIGDSGVAYAGAYTTLANDMDLNGWFYYGKEETTSAIGELTGSLAQNLSVGAQLFYQKNANEQSTRGFGLKIGYGYENLIVSAAYNQVSGVAADNLYGIGPFYVNKEFNTLSEGGNNAKMGVVGLEWDASKLFSNATLALGFGYDFNEEKLYGTDALFAWEIGEKRALQLVYSKSRLYEEFSNFRFYFDQRF